MILYKGHHVSLIVISHNAEQLTNPLLEEFIKMILERSLLLTKTALLCIIQAGTEPNRCKNVRPSDLP